MIRRFSKTWWLIIILCLMSVTSCSSDIGEIENQNYATAIGVDFVDDEYVIYIQMIGLGSIAKSENGEKSPPKVYVSKTKGKTFIDGFFKAYHTAQERILWAHVTAIVLSQSALEQGLGNIFDGLTRYYEFRPTPWMFATKDSIEDILTASGFFQQSSLNTILHSPESSYEQSSTIKPVKLNRMAREVTEPGRTTYLPSLSVNKKQWAINSKKEPKLEINGAFYLKGQDFQGFFSWEQLKGMRWITSETQRASLLVPEGNNPEFVAVLKNQAFDIQPIKSNDNFEFKLTYLATGLISNRMKNNVINIEAMEDFTQETIIAEIRDLYQLGLKHNVDFLNLEHQLYRKHHSDWKRLKEQETLLREDSIKGIHAAITLEHSGSFKNRKIRIGE
ncbi:Ger(x)C family spore germination protein [Bacillus dakarensis]|uniref:Ger(x)C family spore germination protein n=1 Tax=Robertmurraya dakarensis TaxID=1926278 RepID=UPI000980EF99|nr:Ger(x)C family spore germination protein [Bacillus dakarensis]